ncbi:hypothetical protein DPMN_083811 [Dreissena polymorpha]|uniref:Uncharacterized protein n=1 Tax=Dreissena polymorpha TaxID=45954 RepID=A0A9D3YDE2_DREPO|nr:hypothetical protein DPMN_083811 [Dreissena polymorpha]
MKIPTSLTSQLELGLPVNKGKSKLLKTNTSNDKIITVQHLALNEKLRFNHLGIILDNHGGTDADVRTASVKHDTSAE